MPQEEISSGTAGRPGAHPGEQLDAREIVMGLHWDPPQEPAQEAPPDLDAACVLFDMHGRILEIVGPGRLRNANGSVIHTGDSRTGASTWDDEQIFVFVQALPESVAAMKWVVMNAGHKPWREIAGASCHLSDHATATECVRLDLTKLEAHAAHAVGTLWRSPVGWRLSAGPEKVHEAILAELSHIIQSSKSADL